MSLIRLAALHSRYRIVASACDNVDVDIDIDDSPAPAPHFRAEHLSTSANRQRDSVVLPQLRRANLALATLPASNKRQNTGNFARYIG